VVVVGAGITGLSAAHRLMVDRPGLEVTVLEAAPVAGGRLVTTPFAGLPVDEGADSFLLRVPWAADLCTELGLSDELVAPSARSASLWLDERLRPIPAGSRSTLRWSSRASSPRPT
jgi:oxygen-dependent protoporphyrinogen oxidase